jgi:hypothetical protein
MENEFADPLAAQHDPGVEPQTVPGQRSNVRREACAADGPANAR